MPNSLEVREVSEQRGHGHVLGAKTKGKRKQKEAASVRDGSHRRLATYARKYYFYNSAGNMMRWTR